MCTFWNHMVYNPINNSTPNFSKTKCIKMCIHLFYCCCILLTSNQVLRLHDTEWQKLFYVATICSLSSPYHFFPSFDGNYFAAALVISELKRNFLVNIIFSVVRMKFKFTWYYPTNLYSFKNWRTLSGESLTNRLSGPNKSAFPSDFAGSSLFLR